MRELFLLLDEKHRKFIELLCGANGIHGEKQISECLKQSEMPKLIHLTRVVRELDISHVTASNLVRKFERVGLVTTKGIGRVKLIFPTPRMMEIWEVVRDESEEAMKSEVE